MSLEIRFQQDSNSFPQYLSLQDGESLQVFSGEIFQIQNPQAVAQLVPQANDLQIVCHDGSSHILKSFLDVQFSQEPTLEIKEGTSITWHDFVQQSEEVDLAEIADDQYNQSLWFAPLHVIAMTSESQKWDLSHFPPESDEQVSSSGIVSGEPARMSSNEKDHGLENSDTRTAPKFGEAIVETGMDESDLDSGSPIGFGSDDGEKDNHLPYTTSTALNEIEIDIREFIPQLHEDNRSDDLTITANIVGDNPTEIIVDPETGILRLPESIFEDDPQKKFIISIRDKGIETGTAITITQTKDGGGEAFHLILSHNRVTENNEGALIGKLDTDDSGQGHNYEYTILNDDAGVFEIVGNVLKLKEGVSIDYEAQPGRYPITIVSIDENGNRIEQTMSVWPEDVNEAASVAAVGVSSLEDVTITFNPEDFENSFEDEDSDYLEMIRIDSLPDNGVLWLGGDRVTNGQLIDIDQVEDLEFHPDVNWNGETEFTWSGFDGQKWSGQSSPVNIAIEAVNDAPVVNVNVGSESTNTDIVFELSLPEHAFTDADSGDTLTYSAELPSWLTIDPETGTLSGTPGSESVGDHSITITATDSSGESSSQIFVITVDQSNRAPSITQIQDQSTNEDSLFELDLSEHFSYLDTGDTLSFSATLENGDALPDWLSLDSETGTLNGTPQNDDVSDIQISITASDGKESSRQTFSLSVENTNDIPVLKNLTATSPEDAVVRLSTEVLETASDTFSVTVENTNDGPTVTASINDQNTNEDSVFSLNISDNFSDSDLGDELVFEATLENGDPLPSWLSFDESTGQFSGEPSNGDVGKLSITVVASDGEELISDTFTLEVQNTNDGPVATADTASVTETNTVTIDVLANDTDDEGGDDTIIGGAGNDNLYGGGGDDTFEVSEGDGADDFYGDEGTDTVKATGENVDITIDGHFSSSNSIENISSDGHSNVTISGNGSSQTLDFSSTNLDGIDTIDGGAGHDTITGTANDDTIIGGSGNDTINAGDGDDTIDATEGSDNVDAGSGDDTITVSDNILSGGDFDGGEGEDALVFDGADLDIDLSTLDVGGLQNIEHINIDGSGSNNLRLSADDVLDITDGDNRLFIDGDSDDSVEISADYASQGTESVDGVDYTHYYDAGTDSHLYINNDISDLNTF